MGCEIGQWREWNAEESLDWHLLEEADHKGSRIWCASSTVCTGKRPLWEDDVDPTGFQWIDATKRGKYCFLYALAAAAKRQMVCLCNFSPVFDLATGSACPGPASTAKC